MIIKYVNIVFLFFLPAFCLSQNKQLIDSVGIKEIYRLKQQLILTNDDSSRISIMGGIGFNYEALNADSSLKYLNSALDLARKHGYAWGEARMMASLSSVLRQQGKFAEALDLLFKSLKIAQENNLVYDLARAYRRLGLVYLDLENFPKAVTYLLQALEIDEANANNTSAAIDHVWLAEAYEKMNKLDSASIHSNSAFERNKITAPDFYYINANIQVKKNNYGRALILYEEGLSLGQKYNDLIVSSKICANLSNLFIKKNNRDSAIFYALKGFDYSRQVSFKKGIILNGSLLAGIYDSIQPTTALKYMKIVLAAKDSLFGATNIQTIQNLVAREEAKQKELEDADTAYRNKLKLYSLLAGLAVLLIVAFILYRNNKQKQKANILLQHQKEKIETTLTELKSTQAQLVQSEKMASLGELTAGIAHEIQNPLNFVNNFSEVSTELLDEMITELGNDNRKDAIAIADDIKQNLEKILHHGKRADGIVKGMLQHSRSSSALKEPTDINKLADEYLRLTYHGLRAKDKTFNAAIQTDFDQSLGKINIIPQDIGRVLLNLYTNAFYAVSEKRKLQPGSYEGTVSVSTKREGDKVVIKITDNGTGIPQKLIDKIFQPFFTTKPTGQGTGLGLSLSYDIIKAHGGEIRVETQEGEGSEFIICLPVV